MSARCALDCVCNAAARQRNMAGKLHQPRKQQWPWHSTDNHPCARARAPPCPACLPPPQVPIEELLREFFEGMSRESAAAALQPLQAYLSARRASSAAAGGTASAGPEPQPSPRASAASAGPEPQPGPQVKTAAQDWQAALHRWEAGSMIADKWPRRCHTRGVCQPPPQHCLTSLPVINFPCLQAPMPEQELLGAHLEEMRRLGAVATTAAAAASAAMEAQAAERQRSLAHAGPAFAAALVSFLVQLPAWLVFILALTDPVEACLNVVDWAEGGGSGWLLLIFWAWVAKWLWGGAMELIAAGAWYYDARHGNIKH